MWKELMVELESLTEANGVNAHRVATIARQFLRDKKWIDDVHGGKRDEAEKELSKFSKRMALSLDSLICMIEFFPKVESWDGADLEEMRWEAAKLLNAQRAKPKTFKPDVSSLSAPKAANWPSNSTTNKRAPEQPEPPEFPSERQKSASDTRSNRTIKLLQQKLAEEREAHKRECNRYERIIDDQKEAIKILKRQLRDAMQPA